MTTKQTVWSVRHYDHSRVALGETFPSSLHFDLYLDKIGGVQYDLDFTDPLCNKANTRPYYTDYVLNRAGVGIQAGIHTAVGVNTDVETHVLQVSGQDWLHYLEGCMWPFDPTNPTGNLYVVSGRDIALVVKDLFDTTFAQTNRLDISYTLSAIGQLTDYKIDVADTTNLFERVSTLAQTKPGFDFDFLADITRTFKLYAGKKGNQSNPFYFHQDSGGGNCQLTSYGNNGPKGTYLLATATGATGAGQLGATRSATNQGTARRWDVAEQFDNVSSQSQLNSYADGQIDRDSTDQLSFTVRYLLNDGSTDDFWTNVGMGDTCPVYIEIGDYDVIDGHYRIVGISGDVDDDGNEDLAITFDDGSLSL